MSAVKTEMPLWAQVAAAGWLLGVVAFFLRQALVAYIAALGGG